AASVLITGTGYRAQLAIIDNDFTFELFDIIDPPTDTFIYKTPVAAGDLDGDGRDEVVMGTAYGSSAGSGDMHIYEYLPEDDSYELNTSIGASFLDTWLDIGDVDCDGLDEIVGSGRYHTGVIDDAKHSYAVMGSNTDVGGVVRIGDLDGDGVRLKYTQESWNNTPPPGVVAVIAAPPLYDGIDQNYISSYTAFGQETSIGTGIGSEIGTIISTTYSFEQAFDLQFIELCSFSAKRTVASEFIRTNTKTHTEIKTTSHATGWTDNSVLFHVTSYTSYKYQIIHHPYNSSLVGSNMTIDVPDSPVLNAWTIPYFNSVYDQKVGPETLNHTIGQPWTYPSKSESFVMAPNRWEAGEQIVGQGSGFTTITIEVAEQLSSGIEKVESSNYGLGGAIAGTGYERSRGTHDSDIFEIIVGESAIFEGCVGYIANEEIWGELNYTYNLFAYYHMTPDDRTYLVINYYVVGASVFVPTTTAPTTSVTSSVETTPGDTILDDSPEGFLSTGYGVLGFLMIITTIRAIRRKRD
ncbi:MAG: VCBS repeat-containing protein, partial [Candidatus Heimdallarchaeota archaeon]|nr:VCBS repeat-containing protein [Candidatus Heimdallarchaeota archaeon]